MDLQPRVLEYALGRVLDPTDEPDLTEQILAAFERGERGSYQEDPGAEAPVPAARPRPVWPYAAAAGLTLLAAGAALWWGSSRGSAEAPHVVARAADGGVRVRDADGRWPVTSEVAAGSAVAVADGRPAELALEGGASLRVPAAALLRIGARETAAEDRALDLELAYGTVDAHSAPAEAGSAPLRLATDFARLELAAGSRAVVSLAFDDGAPPAESALLAGATPGLRWLDVSLVAGQGRLVHGERSTHVGAGEELRLCSWQPDAVLSPDTLDALRDVMAKLAALDLYDPADPKRQQAFEQAFALREEFYAAVQEEPVYLFAFRDEMLAMFREQTAPGEWSTQTVDMLVQSGAPGTRLLREAWLIGPHRFNADHVLLLADRGLFEFEREVRETVRLADEAGPVEVRAAVSLALRGDDLGQPLILRALDEQAWDVEDFAPALACAFALERLGQREYWPRVLRTALDAAEEHLADGELKPAVAIVLTAQFLDALRESPERLRWNAFTEDLEKRRAEQELAPWDADEVRRRLEDLR